MSYGITAALSAQTGVVVVQDLLVPRDTLVEVGGIGVTAVESFTGFQKTHQIQGLHEGLDVLIGSF